MMGMCPHCGELFDMTKLLETAKTILIPIHDWPKSTRQICPGSQQNWRDPDADGRPLWSGKANPHYYRRKESHEQTEK